MRNGSDVFDRVDFHTDGGDTADGGITTGSRSVDPDFHILHAESFGFLRGIGGDHLSGISRALAGSLESVLAGAGPAKDIPVKIGEGNLGVVEGGVNISRSGSTVSFASST